ncbi:MAG TPA: heparan-alpha-glucosaminide N-acetyltransferase domain-containing protein [Mucilaginibacter sp.]
MKERIHSIDIVRGLIMIIMTLDHVRDFLSPGPSPVNMQTTTVILFFTRWITHFCAPTFVFLSGASAFLAGQRRSKNELSTFLLKRGLWLILSDILIITFLFTFDPLYHTIVLEVLCAIGFGMIILAFMSRVQLPVIAASGLIIMFGHNLLDYVQVPPHTLIDSFTTVLLSAGASVIPLGGSRMLLELYAVIPWTGAMLLGYSFGTLYQAGFNSERRRKILWVAGITLCGIFVVFRLINHYGDPAPWSVQRNAAHTLLSFLNATKQPPSLLYLSMTLGPVLIFLALAEKMKGWFAAVCEVYGNVPYFYFILHLCFIRIINIALILLQGIPMKSAEPLVWQATGFGYPLWTVYMFWLLVVTTLYFPCKWYRTYKQTHKQWWLSYL